MKTDLSMAANIFGALKPDIVSRIEQFMAKPTERNWHDIHTIILNGDAHIGVWQAVIAIDPTFPKIGRTTDQHGNVLERWKRIPTPEQVRQAIAYASH